MERENDRESKRLEWRVGESKRYKKRQWKKVNEGGKNG